MRTNKRLDSICIYRQKINPKIGVSLLEKEQPQALRVTCKIVPISALIQLEDDIKNTINYDSVAQVIDKVSQEKEYSLIETLAEAIADKILKEFLVEEVKVSIEKFFLPNTDSVIVALTKQQSSL